MKFSSIKIEFKRDSFNKIVEIHTNNNISIKFTDRIHEKDIFWPQPDYCCLQESLLLSNLGIEVGIGIRDPRRFVSRAPAPIGGGGDWCTTDKAVI